jgi:UV DNA damage endonuclease
MSKPKLIIVKKVKREPIIEPEPEPIIEPEPISEPIKEPPKLQLRIKSLKNCDNLRLGYACINTSINYCVNRSCIAKTFREKGAEYAIGLAKSNLASVLKILEWNEANNIKLYRMSSDMIPHITNPEFIDDKKGHKYAYGLENFSDLCDQIGAYARKYNHRLTFHPDQFNQVASPNEKVFEKTVKDLSFHADLLDMMGMDGNSVMVVHGGGMYDDKKATLERWVTRFWMLPENVRNRLVIENCERCYSAIDLLPVARAIRRPLVFDTHHHQCYDISTEKLPDPSTFMREVLDTWKICNIRPKFHISEQNIDKRLGAHSDYVYNIPNYLYDIIKTGEEIDIMIEAKAKELAVLKLYSIYAI